MGRIRIPFSIIISLVLILVIAALSCSSRATSTNPSTAVPTSTPSISKTPTTTNTAPKTTVSLDPSKSLQTFLASSSRHFKSAYEARVAGSSTIVEAFDFEVWQKNQNMRIDYYKNGVMDRTLLVNGDSANYYFYGSKNITAPTMPANYYLDLFSQDYSNASMSSTTSGTVFTFAVNSFYKKSGATQGYYVTDVNYTFDSGGTMIQTCYGNSSSGSRPSTVNTVTQTFSLIENDAVISDSVFMPPF
jgi:hypothetical protein